MHYAPLASERPVQIAITCPSSPTKPTVPGALVAFPKLASACSRPGLLSIRVETPFFCYCVQTTVKPASVPLVRATFGLCECKFRHKCRPEVLAPLWVPGCSPDNQGDAYVNVSIDEFSLT